ncbi:hypothetical protein ANN_22847 [Periplaneta americana]|uniref:Uncharacterized protein n=1 Tax=Periplaneta americana TaxID=6978 RepID=A0ABQ8SLF6_PERAM|nr:hypothetical protein ANN_22847 [Periplaneta americana]
MAGLCEGGNEPPGSLKATCILRWQRTPEGMLTITEQETRALEKRRVGIKREIKRQEVIGKKLVKRLRVRVIARILGQQLLHSGRDSFQTDLYRISNQQSRRYGS